MSQIYYYDGSQCDPYYLQNDQIYLQNGPYLNPDGSGDCMIDTCHKLNVDGQSQPDPKCSNFPGSPYLYQSFASSFVTNCNQPVPYSCGAKNQFSSCGAKK